MNGAIRGVIFDLDGTLIDSKEDLADSTNRVLRGEGFPEWPLESYGLFLGRGIRNLVWNALPESQRNEETIERCREKIMADYGERYAVKTRLYDGIGLLLSNLKRQGVKTGVLSNKPDSITCKIMDRLFSEWPFDCVLGAGTELPMKPEPDAVFHICRQFGLLPEEVILIGDSDVDMQTAANAGIRGIGVSWGFRSREELCRTGAWKIVDRAEEINGIVKDRQR